MATITVPDWLVPVKATPVLATANPNVFLAPATANDATAGIPVWAAALTTAGTAIGAYHGYKRHGSVLWALGWGLFGGLLPVVAIPVAFAQGLSKAEKR
jgi:hypothetical protein